ncbi:TetR/AcrR family transcriptional regulator [Allokutzneria sp. A3M-2-11 16]|uniref:TetR/AcrR family transcriptional regulator n=1 Tax=Allokutzneria sp. A3M-2-11 16 TaxID=2962043 RepID=UPI0020B86489|nr:TetR/AcrR family transcriptional regulator [Allokutzneria sp. A3M-2-11 16]MCP3803914.1 TetR/AcrR family transcriptional regulator [Allokutzneria sp. A3M-2-11 16]
MSPNEPGGLRERKKLATREALSAAALRLALEHGPENVRVDDIAEAAGVSPRTYNNYFSSREQAIVAALAAERALRVGAALRARPADEPLADAVVAAVLDLCTSTDEPSGDALTLITSNPALRKAFVQTLTEIEQPLAAAIEARTGTRGLAPTVLAAAVSAAARVALENWVSPAPGNPLLVVPQGSLAELMREALGHVAPALDAADH